MNEAALARVLAKARGLLADQSELRRLASATPTATTPRPSVRAVAVPPLGVRQSVEESLRRLCRLHPAISAGVGPPTPCINCGAPPVASWGLGVCFACWHRITA